jgi:hypothetical protein
MTHIGRCTASPGLLLVELQYSTSKTGSLGDRQLTGALLRLLLLLLLIALLCRMKSGLICSPLCRRHIALQMQLPLSEVELNSSQGGLPVGELELLVLDTELSLPALQFKLPDLSPLLLERKCSKEASVLAVLEVDARLLNLELKALIARLRFDEREAELKDLHVHL